MEEKGVQQYQHCMRSEVINLNLNKILNLLNRLQPFFLIHPPDTCPSVRSSTDFDCPKTANTDVNARDTSQCLQFLTSSERRERQSNCSKLLTGHSQQIVVRVGHCAVAVRSDFAHGHSGVHFARTAVKTGEGKRRRRQTKHYNRRKTFLKLPCTSVRPRPNVKPNGDDQYVVERILAVFARGDRRAYFLDWHGSPRKESWVVSEDCDCVEYVAQFTAVTTAEGVLDCLLGESVPEHILELLQGSTKFIHVREMLGTNVAPATDVNLSFAPNINERQKAKALRTLGSFIKECIDA
uniref:Chromo domain-containing protein n=1 Tax=Globodera rostochiensis TaxID=31243 RepID=A0A914H018_GLORO